MSDKNKSAEKPQLIASCNSAPLTLDLALTRWSVVCQVWGEMAACHAPYLPAFLAGWMCRTIGASRPEDLGQFRDSFAAGWDQADSEVGIWYQQNTQDHTRNEGSEE